MQTETELAELIFGHLCEHHAEAVAGLRDEEIRRRARVAVQRALPYGFQRETSVAAFAALMFLVAPNFDEHPAIKAALSDPSVVPDVRMERLMGNTSEGDWEAAGAQADAAAWGIVVTEPRARP